MRTDHDSNQRRREGSPAKLTGKRYGRPCTLSLRNQEEWPVPTLWGCVASILHARACCQRVPCSITTVSSPVASVVGVEYGRKSCTYREADLDWEWYVWQKSRFTIAWDPLPLNLGVPRYRHCGMRSSPCAYCMFTVMFLWKDL